MRTASSSTGISGMSGMAASSKGGAATPSGSAGLHHESRKLRVEPAKLLTLIKLRLTKTQGLDTGILRFAKTSSRGDTGGSMVMIA
jgi:hypothetical protein